MGKRSDPLLSFCELLMARIAWIVKDVHILWMRMKNFFRSRIGVEAHDRKCESSNCCVDVSISLWIIEKSGRAGSSLSFGDGKLSVVWDRFAERRRQGPYQMVYASSVSIGPLLFGYKSSNNTWVELDR
jgi:hypothetical protein